MKIIKMDNFDLKKYLVENKVTTNSRMLEVEMGMVPADVTGKDSYDGALPAGVKEELPKLDMSAIASMVSSKLPIGKIAAKIKNDPKALDALNKLADMYGLNRMNELDSSDMKSIEIAATQFASTVKEERSANATVAMTVFGGPLLMTIPGVWNFLQDIAYKLQGFGTHAAGFVGDLQIFTTPTTPDVLTTRAIMYIMSMIAGFIIGIILDALADNS
jgi:hypothetical protein